MPFFLLLFSVDLHAGMRDYDVFMRMPRLMITGAVESRYDDYYSKAGDSSSHSYSFSEHINLNARGFLVDRRLLQYGVGVDYQRSDGTVSAGDVKSANLNLTIFPFNPFNVALRAAYTEGSGSEFKSIGVTLTYSRKVIPQRVIEQLQERLKQQRQKQQQQQQQSNSEEEKETGGAAKANSAEKNAADEAIIREEMKKYEKGFLYYFLPKLFVLDFDAYSSDSGGSSSNTYSGRLAMKGDYGKTDYLLTISDVYQTSSDGASQNNFASDLLTRTRWNKWSFMGMDNSAYYYKSEDSSSYGLASSINGFLTQSRKWDYSLNAGYRVTDNGSTSTEYSVVGSTSSYSKWRNTLLNYRFSAGYSRFDATEVYDNAFATASLGTSTPLSSKASLSSYSSLVGGTSGSSYSFGTNLNYAASPRLHLYARYGISGGITQVETGPNSALPDKGPRQTAGVGASYYHRVSLSSDLSASWAPGSESWRSYTTASTRIWLLSFVAGANLSRDKNTNSLDLAATESTGYSFFSTISGPFFMRNSSFSLNATYTKNDTKNVLTGIKSSTDSWTVNPFITWFWRRLIITADGRYVVTNSSETPRLIDRRITLRVTRPFRLL